MSLDLTLYTKQRRKAVGTGVYIRRNGETVELQTIEEVKQHFPDADTGGIEERIYETCDVFSGNITHNLCEMAGHVTCNNGNYTLYDLLWHPDEHGFDRVTEEYRRCVAECMCYLITHRKDLLQYNPSNGWGSYDSLYSFTERLLKVLSALDCEDEIEIDAWT